MPFISRPDMNRGLSPKEQPVAMPYAAGGRGMALHQLNLPNAVRQAGEGAPVWRWL